jgi:hypothetical protein
MFAVIRLASSLATIQPARWGGNFLASEVFDVFDLYRGWSLKRLIGVRAQ